MFVLPGVKMTQSIDDSSAWTPGVSPGIPSELRLFETIFRPEWVFSRAELVEDLASLTGLPHEELTEFRPERLVLHELIIRVTADIAIVEDKEHAAFGQKFREIVETIRSKYVFSRMDDIRDCYENLSRNAEAAVRQVLTETLFAIAAPPSSRKVRLGWLGKVRQSSKPLESTEEQSYRVIFEYKKAGLSAENPLQRAVFKSLYRVLGAIAAMRGSVGSDQELLVRLVRNHICNNYGSHLIGQKITPIIEAAIERECYTRIQSRENPVLISLKGASASGKSSLRPMLKTIMRRHGIEPDGYSTISPDIWRRLLLDYESLGTAYKYASYFTSRELMVIDSKLDRYIRFKANRDRAIPHFLIDRFRLDSFSSDKVERILHNTYAKYVHIMYMYFLVTPPEETVERGWWRALECGRYKATEDFLGHCIESYTGMPNILFKWLSYRRPEYRYHFLDNSVPKGTAPKTIAFGTQGEISIYDPVALVNIERYQKLNIYAKSRADVYPPAPAMDVEKNTGFLKKCIEQIRKVSFIERATGIIYAHVLDKRFEIIDSEVYARVLADKEVSAIFRAIAPS